MAKVIGASRPSHEKVVAAVPRPQKNDTIQKRRSRIFRCVAAATVGGIFSILAVTADADTWPARPIKVIVPYGAGGLTDSVARVTSTRLAETLGQPFVIENRPGALGTIGTQYAINSPADGYTLFMGAGSLLLAVPHMQKLNFDPVAQLQPIGIVGFNAFIVGLNLAVPVNSFAELLSYIRANPGKLNYGIAQVGTASHLIPGLISSQQNLSMVGVPFSGIPTAVTGLIQGNVQMFFGPTPDLLPLVSSGQIKAIAVTSPERLPQLPNVPTLGETMPGFSFTTWNGYFAPTGVPKSVVDRLSPEILRLPNDPVIAKRFEAMGITASVTTPEQTSEIIRRERPIYEMAIRASGLMRQQ